MPYIKINIDSAKLVLEEKGAMATNDYVLKLQCGKKKFQLIGEQRDNFVDFENPIQIGPVANMLHVLFGARPTPTYREVLYTNNKEIVNIAKNGWYKINTIYYYEDKNGMKRPICEFALGKKNTFNSHAKSFYTTYKNGVVKGDVTWDTLKRRYLIDNENKYQIIVNFLQDKLNYKNIIKDTTLLDALKEIANTSYKNECIEFFQTLGGLQTFIDFINDKTDNFLSFNSFSTKLSARLNNVHMNHKITLNCEFIFEVTEQQYYDLINGTQCATFLDGGYAKLEPKMFNETFIDFDDYNKIFVETEENEI